MVERRIRASIVTVLLASSLVTVGGGPASAACAHPERTLGEIIDSGDTGSTYSDTLFVGRVRQLRRARDGMVPARFRVRAVAAGHAADRVTVWGADPDDNMSMSEEVVFRDGGRYVVQGHKLRSGGFTTSACTHTRRISRERMRELLRRIRHA
ncbi:MAG: hypothetical protein WEA54_01585 [Actinomycetota bacterium]